MKSVYFFGNPLVRVDKKPLELIPKLIKFCEEINFIYSDPTENINLEDKNLLVLDTVLGIKTVTIFNDLDSFVRSSRYSVHDYDVLSDAALLLKLGKINKVTIIGIPAEGKIEELVQQTKEALLTTI